MPSAPVLTYFDMPRGRGEDCRLALFLAGVDFEDDRVPFPRWPELKDQTPFGALPTLRVEGKGTLAQSNAILVYVGTLHGMHPSDPWEAARHLSVMCAAEELRSQIVATFTIEDAAKQRTREELAASFIPRWAEQVSAQLDETGPFFAGSILHVVDLKLFVLMRWFVEGGVDHVPTDVLHRYDRLAQLFAAVKEHPKVAQWYARG
jgi:prostaglandin-H2 D-isomerase / glutathione transferase